MCGIVGGVSNNNIAPLLLEGLNRLEYRGYDSSGLIVLTSKNSFDRIRSVGKVRNLEKNLKLRSEEINGKIGIAHTRWATHGEPSSLNAHPHISKNTISVVHNGIIENYVELKNKQLKQDYDFQSDTDTEVIAHAIDSELQSNIPLIESVQKAVKSLKGSYGLGIISSKHPDQIIATRKGSPLIIGISNKGNYIASDQMALISKTKKFIFLEEGDIAEIKIDKVTIYDLDGKLVNRPLIKSHLKAGQTFKGNFDHYMQKEIFEQPQAIRDTLESRITNDSVISASFGYQANEIFRSITQIQIVACGTSFNAGLVAKYWIEDIAKIPCNVEIASEYRYRRPIVLNQTLFVTLSQSGETADTLEALKAANKANSSLKSLCISNSAESSLIRLSDLKFLTHAGPEIGVASTKAFTTQLVSLSLLLCSIGKLKGYINKARERNC
jgi:glucosamine--fructose-6-phosphate aminotransferase (isomerizing)